VSATLRFAIRKFAPFESAIRRQFDDFVRASNARASIEIEALDLNPLRDRLFGQSAMTDGAIDIAFLTTDWVAQAQSAGIIADLKPHLARGPIPDFPDAWSRAAVACFQRLFSRAKLRNKLAQTGGWGERRFE